MFYQSLKKCRLHPRDVGRLSYPFAVWLVASAMALPVMADPMFSIGGLAVDETLSRVGHLFYEELLDGWEIPADYTITVHERPDVFAGNLVWIEVDDTIVFQDRVGTRSAGIEEKAQAARAELEFFLKQNKEALRGLEVY